jgi:hypothetical protein
LNGTMGGLRHLRLRLDGQNSMLHPLLAEKTGIGGLSARLPSKDLRAPWRFLAGSAAPNRQTFSAAITAERRASAPEGEVLQLRSATPAIPEAPLWRPTGGGAISVCKFGPGNDPFRHPTEFIARQGSAVVRVHADSHSPTHPSVSPPGAVQDDGGDLTSPLTAVASGTGHPEGTAIRNPIGRDRSYVARHRRGNSHQSKQEIPRRDAKEPEALCE